MGTYITIKLNKINSCNYGEKLITVYYILKLLLIKCNDTL